MSGQRGPPAGHGARGGAVAGGSTAQALAQCPCCKKMAMARLLEFDYRGPPKGILLRLTIQQNSANKKSRKWAGRPLCCLNFLVTDLLDIFALFWSIPMTGSFKTSTWFDYPRNAQRVSLLLNPHSPKFLHHLTPVACNIGFIVRRSDATKPYVL